MASVGFTLAVASAANAAPGGPAAIPFQDGAPTADTCASFTAEYVLAARLRLEDTPYGAGNGTYDVGPGKATLRFTAPPGERTPTQVELLSYQMQEHFAVESHVLFIGAKVTTDSVTSATPDESGIIATGRIVNDQIVWSTLVQGYRTDGALHCDGSGCGMSGAPPKGDSALHIGPNAVSFSPFRFDSPNFATFRMAYTKVAHTDRPQQTAFLSIAARQTSRQCVGNE